MPSPAIAWGTNTPLTAKSLNIALYTVDGTTDNPNGVAFHAQRPLMMESYRQSLSLSSSPTGVRTSMAGSGSINAPCFVVMDTAGYFGQTSDLPGYGYYQYKCAIAGSSGDGVNPGGWAVISHFVPVNNSGSQTVAGADLLQDGVLSLTGTRQPVATTHHNTPFFIDLVNTGTHTWTPAVRVDDTSSAATSVVFNSTDSSGETPRFTVIWAAIAATSSGLAVYTTHGTFAFTASSGITNVVVSTTGAGGGGGGGQPTYGGGGAGGGESASDTVGVTAGNTYTVTVGAGGTGGAAGVSGTAGGSSSFSGDTLTAIGHGGSGGIGATTTSNGSGGSGGTGSTNTIHFNGGNGAAGSTGSSGGGGGSSAGTGAAGNNATSYKGATAPNGGGVGGNGGRAVISIVQSQTGYTAGTNTFSISFANPVQAGNTITACIVHQSTSPSSDPVCKLSDGTAMTSQVTADYSGASPQIGIFDAQNVTGGQTGITITSTGTAPLITCVQMWEVSGLGASPSIDVTGTGNKSSSSYSSSATTKGAPDLWVGTVGCQTNLGGFNINSPGGNWNVFSQSEAYSSGIWTGIRSGYQLSSSPGTMTYSGSTSRNVLWGSAVLAYTASIVTPGTTPNLGPGGGGGGGLAANGGGNGFDGSVSLTWISQSNSNYGTPSLPSPAVNWSVGDTTNAALINGNKGIRDVINFLSNPPVFRAHTLTAQAIANQTNVTVSLGTVDVDSYAGWNGTTNTYTIQRNGLYLIGAIGSFAAVSGGYRDIGVSINGQIYWGPAYSHAGTTDQVYASKVQVFSLLAGDTIQLIARQNSGSSVNLSTVSQSRLFLVWLSKAGSPPNPWAPPDIGFRWKSGTDANTLLSNFQNYLSNDLGFLVQKPFFMGYQTVAQTGFASSGSGASYVGNIGIGTLNSNTGTTIMGSVLNPTSGSGSLIAAIAFGNQGGTVTALTDTKNNTYIKDYAANTVTSNGRGLEIWRCVSFTALTTSDTITATLSSTQDHGASMIIDQFSSLNAPDVTAMAFTGSGTTTLTATATATGSDSVMYAAVAVNAPNQFPGVNSPFNQGSFGDLSSTLSNGNGIDLLTTYDASISAGSLSAVFNWISSHTAVADIAGYPSPVSTGGFYTVTLDTVGGIIHGDQGDNYAGWQSGSSNRYTVQIPGWYLVCGEMFATFNSAAGASVVAALATTSSGGFAPASTPDQFQNNLATTVNTTVGGGATIFGLYYFNAGESISPQILGQSYSGTWGTLYAPNNNSGTFTCHMELVWLSE